MFYGTKDALRAISTNSQISSRFRPMYLTKWKMNKDFITLFSNNLKYASFEKEIKYFEQKCSRIGTWNVEGYIGEIINLLKESTIYAIRTGSEQITIDELKMWFQ